MKKFVGGLILLIVLTNVVQASTGTISSLSWGTSITGAQLSGEKFLFDELDESQLSNPNWKARAILDFRAREQTLINKVFNDTSYWAIMSIQVAQAQIAEISKELDEIDKDFADLLNRKLRISQKYSQTQKVVSQLILNVKRLQKEMDNRMLRIDILTRKYFKLKKEIDQLSVQLQDSKEQLLLYTEALYRIKNEFYTIDDNFYIDDIKLLVNSQDTIADSLVKENIVKSLWYQIKKLVDILRVKKKQYETLSLKIKDLRSKYKEEIEQYQMEMDLLRAQKKYLVDLLKFFKEEKNLVDFQYHAVASQKELLEQQLSWLVARANQKVSLSASGEDIDISRLIDSDTVPDSDKFMSWPVVDFRGISSFFADEEYRKALWIDHWAIDIRASQWEEIYAPADGVVYKVYDGKWLKWLMILHNHWYVTVYLHLSKILVKEGDFVQRGQLIGLVGGLPWTPGAGNLSSWPHLHFEVWKYGNLMDPLEAMDLSVYPDPAELPLKYQVKYQKDIMQRKIDISKLSKGITWTTVAQRREQFLQKYAIDEFKDVALWQNAQSGTNVDIDVGICIWFAESGLGHNLSSKWNVGNVGNNDRGNRIAFDTPQDGAKAIFRALTNPFLGKYWRIDQLSRYGNEDNHIYASDPINWQKNVIKCLSVIKGHIVDDKFPIRVYTDN